eukprot:GEZU01005472.1.p2 GENE.GEZU01005472.1~~GEZU01005472.1.p2  ORF type:complete len:121 (-),score=17.42 GEZU01005472.1:104-466(-)
MARLRTEIYNESFLAKFHVCRSDVMVERDFLFLETFQFVIVCLAGAGGEALFLFDLDSCTWFFEIKTFIAGFVARHGYLCVMEHWELKAAFVFASMRATRTGGHEQQRTERAYSEIVGTL